MPGQVLLIVLGDPADRVEFNRALRGTPHRLIFAQDGEDGFDRFGEVKPDLMIVHLHAPRLDAAILCPLVRREVAGREIPILLYAEELGDPIVAASKVAAVGATSAFAAPFDPPLLARVLSPFLSVEGVGVQAVGATPDDLDISIDEDPTEALEGFDPALVSAAMADSVELVEMPGSDAEVTDTGLRVERMPVTRVPVNMAFTPTPMIEPAAGFDEPELPTHSRGVARAEIDEDTGQRRIAEIPIERSNAGELEIGGGPSGLPGDTTGRRRIAEIPIERSHSGAWPVKPEAPAAAGLDSSQLGRRLARRVRQTHQLLDELNYYQLLSLEPSASDQNVRDAYFEVSIEFHPDRFFLMKSGDLKEKIYAIYRRVTEAYAVLGNPDRRAAYDAALAQRHEKRAPRGQRSIPTTASSIDPIPDPLRVSAESEEGQIYARLAEKAFSQGDHDGARMFLGLAKVYEPENPSIPVAVEQVLQDRPRPIFGS